MTRKMLIDEATVKLALEALKELVAQTETGLFAVRHDHVAMQDARQAITILREALTSVPDWASEAKEQSAQPTVPQDIPDLIAGALGVSRGTAYDMMREALASEAKEQPAPATELREQEPVATLWQHGRTGRTRITMPGGITDCAADWFKAADLYTSPPAQRTWVELTEDEAFACKGHDYFETYKAIEAKLKEKNT